MEVSIDANMDHIFLHWQFIAIDFPWSSLLEVVQSFFGLDVDGQDDSLFRVDLEHKSSGELENANMDSQ